MVENQEQKNDFINKIYNTDCISGMNSKITDNSIDIFIRKDVI
ncbi:MAG: hypothetical protein RE471_02925 [Ferroplasma sp.]|nr:hypothetical protein [Ferroplasma sp.]WMT51840.1 MAG: hypothetical protein RE471_02925 [Ferroplasma sp.]